MAYGLYDGSIESIPGLGGYVQQKKLNDQETSRNLQNGAQVMQMLQAQKAMQDDQAAREVLSSNLPPEQKIMGLVKLGKNGVELANHYMTINQAQQGLDMMKGLDLASADAPAKLRARALIEPTKATAYIGMADHLEKTAAAQAEHQAQMGAETPIDETPQTGYRNGAFADRSNLPADVQANVPAGVMAANGAQSPTGRWVVGSGPGAVPGRQTSEALPAEVLAAIQSGRPFSMGVGESGNPDMQRTGGLFQSFVDSPIEVIRRDAAQNQGQVNVSNPLSIPPKSWNDKATAMQTREGTLIDRQQGRDDSGALRRELSAAADARATANRDLSAARSGLNPDGTPAAGMGLSDGATEAAAARYRLDGTLPTNLGRGTQGALEIKKILNRAAELAGEAGDTPEQQRIAQLANKASAQGLGQISRQEATLGAFEKNALSNADLAVKASDKVDRTGIPVINRWIQAGRTSITGDEDARVFNAANSTFVSEYAKVMSGGTGASATTEGATHRAQDLLNTADTPGAYRAIVNQLKLEMHNRMAGFAQQKQELMQGMGSAKPAEPAAAPLSPNQVKTPDGQTITFPSGAAAQAFKMQHGLK